MIDPSPSLGYPMTLHPPSPDKPNSAPWPGHNPANPAHQRLAEFLTLDIQTSPAWTAQLVDQLEAIATEKIDRWQRVGNAFCLTLSATGGELRDLVQADRPPVYLSIEELRSAAQAWADRCST